jgi:AcrR family transcriptional regulator
MARGTSREHLVEVARSYLDEHGLEGLTLREVARQAGVSHGAPLRHFSSLAALCSVVATEAFRGLYAGVDRAMDEAGDDPGDRLRAAGAAYVRFAVGNPGSYSLMFRPDRCDGSDPELLDASLAAFGQLLLAVSAAQDAGWQADRQTAELAGVIWSMVHGLASLTIQGSLPAVVGIHGGNTDLTHLVELAQDLLADDVPSTTSRPGGTP